MRRIGLRVMMVGAVVLTTAAPARAALTIQEIKTPTVPGALDPSYGGEMVETPDGSILRVLASTPGIARFDASGRATSTALPENASPDGGSNLLTVLADGSTAFEGFDFFSRGGYGRRLVRLSAAGGAVRSHQVAASGPYATWDPFATAIAPDGSLWRSLACSGVLSQTRPTGVETRFHLRRRGCRNPVDGLDVYGSTFAFGADGSVWFANLCQAQIVKIPLVGKRREWRLGRRPHCQIDDDSRFQQRRPILPLPDGGLRFEHGHITPSGRLVRDRTTVPDAITPDGAEWRVSASGIERRKSGQVRLVTSPVAGGRQVIAWTAGADGRLWYLTARPVDEQSAGIQNADLHVGMLDARGNGTEQPIDPQDPYNVNIAPWLVVGADGAVWLGSSYSVFRVMTDPPLGPAAAPRARAIRLMGRRGATAWVQLSCRARIGVYCVGSVKLASSTGRSLGGAAARFAVPGGERRTIPLTLASAVVRSLHRRHRRATAVVTTHGGTRTRASVVLR